MHAVAGQHGPAARARAMVVMVRVAVVMSVMGMSMVVSLHGRHGLGVAVFMPVVPQLGLVEQEEEHHAHQQGGKQVVGAGLAFKRLGQQVHKGRGQQGARRQAQQVLGAYAARPPAQAQTHQQCGQPDAANTGGQSGQDDCYQSHSFLRFIDKL
ncbi:hypothetical protein D3C72_1774900 [compost metagenome]